MTPRFPPPVVLMVLGLAVAPQAQVHGELADWLAGLRQEALENGISAAALDRALGDFLPLQEVLASQRRQPEMNLSLDQYLRRRISPRRIAAGRQKLAQYRPLLEEISRQYRVQPRFIVALWSLESDFGRYMGDTPVIPALATLAYAGNRSDYFRSELLTALRILDQEGVPPEKLVGSWAGAMGQCQFMPSSFSTRAVDFDRDGRRDIWNTPADVLASIAHYLAQLGWSDDLTWGREVKLTADLDPALFGPNVQKDLQEWQALGVRQVDGQDLPGRSLPGALIRPARSGGRVFLVYANFPLILKWNNSTHFAIAVGQLADQLGR